MPPPFRSLVRSSLILMLLFSHCHPRLFATPWTARQASLSLTVSRNLPKFMSIESFLILSLKLSSF